MLLAFLALCALALLYVSFGIKGALAPFCAVCTAVLWFSLFGALGLLRAGGWLFYLLAAAAAVFLVWRHGVKKAPPPALGFGFWFFAGLSLALLLLLWVKKPLFIYWDEFSFWGAAGKVIKLADELYTTAPVGWAAVATQKPGLPLLSYFFQFFGPGFQEWQTYASADVFMAAGLAAALAPFEKREDWDAALPAMLVLALTPFVFRHGIPYFMVSNVYLDSTAELPMGVCFGAVLAASFEEGRGRLCRALPVCLGIAALVLIKDAALTFALVAAGLAAVVYTAAPLPRAGGVLRGSATRRPALRRAARFCGALALTLGAAAAVFLLWEQYCAAAGLNRAAPSGGAGAGLWQLPGLLLRDMLNPVKSPLYTKVSTLMREYFFARGNMLGSGFTAVLCILALIVSAALLSGKKSPARRRCLWFGLFSALGFAAYYLFLFMSYLYIISEAEARMLASYDRYVYPFYMGWFMAALALFGRAVAVPRAAFVNPGAGPAKAAAAGLDVPAGPKPPAEPMAEAVNPAAPARTGAAGRAKALWRRLAPFVPLAGKALLAVLALGFWLRSAQFLPVNYTLLGVQPEDYSERREFKRRAEWLQTRLAPGGKTFMVLSEDGGLGLYTYVFEMLPWQIDYSYGGGAQLRRQVYTAEGPQPHEISLRELERHLLDSGCTTLFIDSANARFKELYGALFADGMAAWEKGETGLYAVEAAEGGVRLTPVFDGKEAPP